MYCTLFILYYNPPSGYTSIFNLGTYKYNTIMPCHQHQRTGLEYDDDDRARSRMSTAEPYIPKRINNISPQQWGRFTISHTEVRTEAPLLFIIHYITVQQPPETKLHHLYLCVYMYMHMYVHCSLCTALDVMVMGEPKGVFLGLS